MLGVVIGTCPMVVMPGWWLSRTVRLRPAVAVRTERISLNTRVIRVAPGHSRAGLGPGPLPAGRAAGGPVSGVCGWAVPAEHAAGGGLRFEGVLHGDREGPGAGYRGGCVRFPCPPARRPHRGAAGGPGVGVVGADDRPAAVVGVGP